jgi:Mg-chelatase subunit ChlD
VQGCLATITQWIVNLRTGGHEELAHALEMAAVRRSKNRNR